MFMVFLKFAENKALAPQHMQGHNDWLQKGFADGVFLLSGTLQPKLGGGILAHNISLPDLQQRVDADPFVAHRVVTAEVIELTPSKADKRLEFVLAG